MRKGLLILTTILLAVAGDALAGQCQDVYVLDDCSLSAQVYPLGSRSYGSSGFEDLRDGGSNLPTDIVFATAPTSARGTVFITQGKYLRVRGGATRTINVAALTGLEYLQLRTVAAATPLSVTDSSGDTREQFALYLLGNNKGQPYFFVFDQQLILDGSPESEALVGHGALCDQGESCKGQSASVAVTNHPLSGEAQVAFASVLAETASGAEVQRFYSIGRPAAPRGPWSVSLDGQNEGGVWGGILKRRLGVDVDAGQTRVGGVFQTEGQAADLERGGRSCRLPGFPTDLRIWGPAQGMLTPRLQLVTYAGSQESGLAINPWLECPASGARPLSQVSLPPHPIALDLSSRTSDSFWVYVASRGGNGSVTALEYSISSSGISDRLHKLQQFPLDGPACVNLPALSCPIAVAIGPAYQCTPGPPTCDGSTEPPVPCCLDDNDPDPRCQDCFNLPIPGPGDKWLPGK